jgi:hypothetical protein
VASFHDRCRKDGRLRESEFDLQTELEDLADEIRSRQARVCAVLRALRDVRAQIAALEAAA